MEDDAVGAGKEGESTSRTSKRVTRECNGCRRDERWFQLCFLEFNLTPFVLLHIEDP